MADTKADTTAKGRYVGRYNIRSDVVSATGHINLGFTAKIGRYGDRYRGKKGVYLPPYPPPSTAVLSWKLCFYEVNSFTFWIYFSFVVWWT
jgi:hypothetical protein